MKFGDVLRWTDTPDESRFMYVGSNDDGTVFEQVVCIKADPDTLWGDEIGEPTPVNIKTLEVVS